MLNVGRGERSYTSIVVANDFTMLNAILAAFAVVTFVFGDPEGALFPGDGRRELQHRRCAGGSRQAQPRLPRVRGDRVQLQQVVVNLVLNGLEAPAVYMGDNDGSVREKDHSTRGGGWI
jgi:signal transduction histidine kinase